MLQIIKKLFSPSTSSGQVQEKKKKGKNTWAAEQIREMAKLGGKLVL
jgi:hypothetical protein